MKNERTMNYERKHGALTDLEMPTPELFDAIITPAISFVRASVRSIPPPSSGDEHLHHDERR